MNFGVSFCLNTIKLKKISIVRHLSYLMYSMEDKVIPRYRVFEMLKSERLLKKSPSFSNVVGFLEDVFLDKFISRFLVRGCKWLMKNICSNLLKKQKQNRLHNLMDFARN